MQPTSIQLDPLNSPFPIPWNWVLATLAEGNPTPTAKIRYYRSQSLISPNGQSSAYSRIQIRIKPGASSIRVSSVLIVENLNTGELQTLAASSPLSNNPFMVQANQQDAGAISILIPVAWSQDSTQVLAREFESIFGSDIGSDYAVVWDRPREQMYTVAPSGVEYTNAILLGWSQQHPNHVLFQAGNLGDENWATWAVALDNRTSAARGDRPVTFGDVSNNVWAGPQSYR